MADPSPATRSARPIWAEVDLDAVAHNVSVVRTWLRPGLSLGVSIKGDAYGHGAHAVGLELERDGVSFLTTADLQQASKLRQAGCDLPIVLLGSSPPVGLRQCLQAGVVPTIYSEAGARAISDHADGRTPVFVKVDAGLGRLGVPVEEAVDFVRRISRLPGLAVDGIYTHLPFADADGERWASEHLAEFVEAVETLRGSGIEIPTVQAVSSPGVLDGLDHPALNAVCVGALAYGLPVLTVSKNDAGTLRRAMSAVRTRLIHVVKHGRDRSAGSGGARAYPAGTVTGVVPVGLADGYAKPVAGQTAEMVVGGTRTPVVGVTMAHTTLDLTHVPGVLVGDDVTVFGEQQEEEITLDEIAVWTGSTVLEVILRFSRRIEVDHLRLGATGRSPLEPAQSVY